MFVKLWKNITLYPKELPEGIYLLQRQVKPNIFIILNPARLR